MCFPWLKRSAISISFQLRQMKCIRSLFVQKRVYLTPNPPIISRLFLSPNFSPFFFAGTDRISESISVNVPSFIHSPTWGAKVIVTFATKPLYGCLYDVDDLAFDDGDDDGDDDDAIFIN